MPEKINRVSLADDAPMEESELSTVPKGAQGQPFLARKGDEDMAGKDFKIDGAVLLKMVNGGKIEDEEALDVAMEKEGLTDEQRTKLKSMLRLADKVEDFPEQFKKRLGKMLGKGIMKDADSKPFDVPEAGDDGLYDLEKIDERIKPIFESLNKETEEIKKAEADAQKEGGEGDEALKKEHDALQKSHDDLKKENTKMGERVAKMEGERTDEKLEAEVRKDFVHVPGNTIEEKVAILKSADEVGEEHGKAIRKGWTATEKQMVDGDLVKEVHGTNTNDGSVAALKKIAGDLRKADPTLSAGDALQKAAQENRELTQEYETEFTDKQPRK